MRQATHEAGVEVLVDNLQIGRRVVSIHKLSCVDADHDDVLTSGNPKRQDGGRTGDQQQTTNTR